MCLWELSYSVSEVKLSKRVMVGWTLDFISMCTVAVIQELPIAWDAYHRDAVAIQP